jgi:hypothetical protein
MRSRGVPSFPDPSPGADNTKFPDAQQLRVGGAQLTTAETACEHLLPQRVIEELSAPADAQLLLHRMLSFSQCLRSHGLHNWPDPTLGRHGQPSFNLVGIAGLNANSPETMADIHACSHLLPSALGGIAIQEA